MVQLPAEARRAYSVIIMVQLPAEVGMAKLVRNYGSTSSRRWHILVSEGS